MDLGYVRFVCPFLELIIFITSTNNSQHCSNGLPSLCTAKLVQAYFNGSRGSNPNLPQRLDPDPDRGVPQNGTLCVPDVSTFPQPGDEADRKWSMMREEDRELLRALRNIRRGWEEEGGD